MVNIGCRQGYGENLEDSRRRSIGDAAFYLPAYNIMQQTCKKLKISFPRKQNRYKKKISQ